MSAGRQPRLGQLVFLPDDHSVVFVNSPAGETGAGPAAVLPANSPVDKTAYSQISKIHRAGPCQELGEHGGAWPAGVAQQLGLPAGLPPGAFRTRRLGRLLILSLSLAANESLSLAANESLSLAANESLSLAANKSLSLAANESLSLAANKSLSLTANESLSPEAGDSLSLPVAESIGGRAGKTLSLGSVEGVSLPAGESLGHAAGEMALVRKATAAGRLGSRAKGGARRAGRPSTDRPGSRPSARQSPPKPPVTARMALGSGALRVARRLNPEQSAVYDLLRLGLTNGQIGARLSRRRRWVCYRVAEIKLALGVGSRAELFKLSTF